MHVFIITPYKITQFSFSTKHDSSITLCEVRNDISPSWSCCRQKSFSFWNGILKGYVLGSIRVLELNCILWRGILHKHGHQCLLPTNYSHLIGCTRDRLLKGSPMSSSISSKIAVKKLLYMDDLLLAIIYTPDIGSSDSFPVLSKSNICWSVICLVITSISLTFAGSICTLVATLTCSPIISVNIVSILIAIIYDVINIKGDFINRSNSIKIIIISCICSCSSKISSIEGGETSWINQHTV